MILLNISYFGLLYANFKSLESLLQTNNYSVNLEHRTSAFNTVVH